MIPTLGPMPTGRAIMAYDERLVHAPLERIFDLAVRIDEWPQHLSHCRYVRFAERDRGYGGIVALSARRPFGLIDWPVWWTSIMQVDPDIPVIRYRHIAGVSTGMEVEWSFRRAGNDTYVRITHAWDGPGLAIVGRLLARAMIGPLFVHGVASRTLAGLAQIAEQS